MRFRRGGAFSPSASAASSGAASGGFASSHGNSFASSAYQVANAFGAVGNALMSRAQAEYAALAAKQALDDKIALKALDYDDRVALMRLSKSMHGHRY